MYLCFAHAIRVPLIQYGKPSSTRNGYFVVDSRARSCGVCAQTRDPLPHLAGDRRVDLRPIPGVPTLRLDPDIVFLVFLPPILWSAAYFASWRDFRSNLRPITLLAVGLVLATTAAVAVVAPIWLPGLGWAGVIALGAIVSPTVGA